MQSRYAGLYGIGVKQATGFVSERWGEAITVDVILMTESGQKLSGRWEESAEKQGQISVKAVKR